jgi:MFS family permease
MDRQTLSQLRRRRGYPQFVLAATVARLADEMFSVGVVLLVLDRTGSPGLAGATVAAATLPAIASGPVIGAWLDRSGRRSLLYKVDRLVLAGALVGIVLSTGHAPAFVIPVFAFITGITVPATFGGLTSLIPFLVDEDQLAPANALEAASMNTAMVLGPALAGVLAALASPDAAVVAEVALTLVALVLILRIPGLNRAGTGTAERMRSTIAKGLRHVLRDPALRAVTLCEALMMLGLGVLAVAFPLWAAADLHVDQSAAGGLWSAFAVGSLFGALALSGLQRRFPPDRVIFAGLLTMGLLTLTWPLAQSLPVALALVALAAVGEGPALAGTFALRQQRTPRELLAQVMTTLGSLKIGAFSLGAALGGPLVTAVEPRSAIVAVAALQITGVVFGIALRGAGSRATAAAR